jgi:hypothetical protein
MRQLHAMRPVFNQLFDTNIRTISNASVSVNLPEQKLIINYKINSL